MPDNIEGFNDSSGAPILFYACDKGDSIEKDEVEIFCGNSQQAEEISSKGQTKKLKIIGFKKLE